MCSFPTHFIYIFDKNSNKKLNYSNNELPQTDFPCLSYIWMPDSCQTFYLGRLSKNKTEITTCYMKGKLSLLYLPTFYAVCIPAPCRYIKNRQFLFLPPLTYFFLNFLHSYKNQILGKSSII